MTQENLNMSGVISAIQSGTQAINALNQTLNKIFPISTSSITSTASAGTSTLPATPQAFLNITVNGTAYKIPLYLP